MTFSHQQSLEQAQTAPASAAAAALVADLGHHRRELIVLTDKGRRQGPETSPQEALEALRSSNRRGTEEHRHARSNQAALNAWSTLHETQDEEAVVEDDGLDLTATGQSHRLRLRSELQQLAPARSELSQAIPRGGRSGRGGRAGRGGRGGGFSARSLGRLERVSSGTRMPEAEEVVRVVLPAQRHPQPPASKVGRQVGPGQLRGLVETVVAAGAVEQHRSSAEDLSGLVLTPRRDLVFPDRPSAHHLPPIDGILSMGLAELVQLSTRLNQALAGIEACGSALRATESITMMLRSDISKVDTRLAFLGGREGGPSGAGGTGEAQDPLTSRTWLVTNIPTYFGPEDFVPQESSRHVLRITANAGVGELVEFNNHTNAHTALVVTEWSLRIVGDLFNQGSPTIDWWYPSTSFDAAQSLQRPDPQATPELADGAPSSATSLSLSQIITEANEAAINQTILSPASLPPSAREVYYDLLAQFRHAARLFRASTAPASPSSPSTYATAETSQPTFTLLSPHPDDLSEENRNWSIPTQPTPRAHRRSGSDGTHDDGNTDADRSEENRTTNAQHQPTPRVGILIDLDGPCDNEVSRTSHQPTADSEENRSRRAGAFGIGHSSTHRPTPRVGTLIDLGGPEHTEDPRAQHIPILRSDTLIDLLGLDDTWDATTSHRPTPDSEENRSRQAGATHVPRTRTLTILRAYAVNAVTQSEENRTESTQTSNASREDIPIYFYDTDTNNDEATQPEENRAASSSINIPPRPSSSFSFDETYSSDYEATQSEENRTGSAQINVPPTACPPTAETPFGLNRNEGGHSEAGYCESEENKTHSTQNNIPLGSGSINDSDSVYDNEEEETPYQPETDNSDSREEDEDTHSRHRNAAFYSIMTRAGNQARASRLASRVRSPASPAPLPSLNTIEDPAHPLDAGEDPAHLADAGSNPAPPCDAGADPTRPADVGGNPAPLCDAGADLARPADASSNPTRPADVGGNPAASPTAGDDPAEGSSRLRRWARRIIAQRKRR